jgi:phospholipid/cholesterol/gamma-HCH transport system substrate-binding protein
LNELKVGLLTLMAIASLVVVSLKITANKSGFGEYIEYRTILNDASGIYENASIKVAGIVAGRIKSVELSGSQALVSFEVLKSIKVTRFSILKIKSVGFLGDKYIDIYLGNPQAPRLKEGSMLLSEGGAGFEELGKDASEILKDVKEIARSIRESLKDEKGENVVKDIVGNIQGFSKSAKEVAESLERLLKGNESKLNETIDDLKKVTAQLAYETDRYQDGSFMNDMDQLKPILAKVDKSVTDLRDIISDVKAGKGTVGKLLRDEEVVDKVNETLSGINRIVGRVNNFKTNIALYSGVNSEYGGKTDFDLDLIPSPERFFRFGIVVSEFGPDVEDRTTTTTTVDGGTPSVTTRREVEDSAYRFNVQIGRRFNRFMARAGLIESKGGLGFDYLLPEYGVRTGLEIFDYQEDVGPNVRLFTEVRLWNVFYTKLAGEDLANNGEEGQTYTISAGLRFSDEDLAALIGLVAN